MKFNDALCGAALVALGAVVLWHIQGFPPMPGQKYGPAWFPGLIAGGLIICGALLIVSRLRAATPEALLPSRNGRAAPPVSASSRYFGLLLYRFRRCDGIPHCDALTLLVQPVAGLRWLPVSTRRRSYPPRVIQAAQGALPWGLLEHVIY